MTCKHCGKPLKWVNGQLVCVSSQCNPATITTDSTRTKEEA